MPILRRSLYASAALWAASGAVLALAPKWLLVTVFDQLPLTEYAWVRLLGVLTFSLALFMVLVSHRAEDLWWWSWGFVIATGGTAAVATLNAAFGTPKGSSTTLWWLIAAAAWAAAAAILLGLQRVGRTRPPE